MRVKIWSFAVVGICLSIATALSQQTPSQEPKASDPEGSRPQPSKSAPSRLSPYYDRRERAAASMTFEWESSGSRVFSKEYYIQRLQRMLSVLESTDETPEMPKPLAPDVSEIDEKNLLLEALRGTYRIERTPDITRVRVSKDLASISADGLRKSEDPFECTAFYLGKTGEAVISSLGDPSPDSVVHLAFAGAGGIGLPDPILAGVRAEMLVFLGGVSPLRMFGCAPEDWKLVEVSEEAWVFEFDPDEEQRKRMAELSGFGKARVRLNRAYDDAPEQLEIFWRGDSHERWTTEAYRRVNDSWMPSRVLREWSGTDGTGRYVYELVADYALNAHPDRHPRGHACSATGVCWGARSGAASGMRAAESRRSGAQSCCATYGGKSSASRATRGRATSRNRYALPRYKVSYRR
jgi:hypothetical protein